MSTPESSFNNATPPGGEASPALTRARRILAAYYLGIPVVLIYILFKIFPPNPWPTVLDTATNAKVLVEPQNICFFFGRLCLATSLEERLILLVIAAGALGSYIHSATSYADYRGNEQFYPSWMMWYLLRPLVGICLALVIYFTVRGGLLLLVINGSEATEAKNINPFGVAAVSGLTGMFSKQAADKLAEVFTTLFRSAGDAHRKDSLTPAPAPEIKVIDPKQGPVEGGTAVMITGTGFDPRAKLFFGADLASNVTVSSETTINAETPAGQPGEVDVIVQNPDGQKSTLTKGFTYEAQK
jgi:hypothetical protein